VETNADGPTSVANFEWWHSCFIIQMDDEWTATSVTIAVAAAAAVAVAAAAYRRDELFISCNSCS